MLAMSICKIEAENVQEVGDIENELLVSSVDKHHSDSCSSENR